MSVPDRVNLLMRRIEDEVTHRRARMSAPTSATGSLVADLTVDGAEFATIRLAPVHLNLPTYDGDSAKAPFRLKPDASYHLNDFQRYDDVEFINAAYQAILKREADKDGMQTYLAMLRDGASKAEILGRLRDSPEGRLRRARVDGLSRPYVLDAISRWPIIGKFVGVLTAFWNLPDAQRTERRTLNDFASRLDRTDQRIAEATRTIYEALETLGQSQNRLSELTQSFAVRSELEAVRHSMNRLTATLESKSDWSDLEKLALELRAAVSSMEQLKANSHDVAALQTKIAGLAESIWTIEIARGNSEDSHSSRVDSEANLNARIDQAMDLIRGTAQSDQSSIDALRAVQEESTASLQATGEELRRITAALAKADDMIAGVRESKADNADVVLLRYGIDALKRNSMAAIDRALAQWNESVEQIAALKVDQSALRAVQKESTASLQATGDELKRITAALAKADDMIAGVRESKADSADVGLLRSGIDALKQDSMAAIDRARAEWKESVEQIAALKVDHSALRAVQKESTVSLQATGDELKRITAALAKADDMIAGVRESKADSADVGLLRSGIDALKRDSMAAIDRALAQWNESVQQIAAVKVDQSALRAVHDESTAYVKAEIDRAIIQINGIVQTKADQGNVDLVKQELFGAIEQIRAHMLRALEAKAERQETTALSNHLVGLLQRQPSREEFKSLTAALANTDELIAGVRQTKADNADLALLGNSIDALKRDSTAVIERNLAQWNESVERIAALTVDQSAMRAAQAESTASVQATAEDLKRIVAALANTDEVIAGVSQTKADNADVARLGNSIDALKRDSTAAVESVHAKWNESVERIALVKVDQSALRVLQQEGAASLQATGVELKRIAAALVTTDDMIASIRQTKADSADLALLGNSIDALKRDSTAAVESIHAKWNDRVEQIATGKVDQSVLRAVQVESTASLQAMGEELKRIAAAIDKADDVIAGVRQTKADSADLTLLGNRIDALMRGSIAEIDLVHARWNKSVELIAAVKLDQSALRAVQDEGTASLQATAEELKRITAALAKTDDVIGSVGQTKAADLALLKSAIDEVAETRKAVEMLKRDKADRTTTDVVRTETKAALDRMNAHVEDKIAPVSSRIHDLKRNVLDQERRVGLLLEEARRRFPDPISPTQLGAMLTEEDHQLDAMYASFEDKFRGTRSDIRQRQAIYLPYVRDAKAGTSEAPIVDLACGRGEWLEVLSSLGLVAQGVDLNRIFIAGCRELDLDVTEQDVISFLRQRKPNSTGVVTSFHLIEHLPHKKLIALIDETLRVLRPGGLVIFETPNPRNLIVSGCNFYLDPTHRHPLPPDLTRYLLEARGFCNVDILEIHPFEPEFQITEGASKVKDTLNQYLFSAQDYAVIARKP